MAHWKKNNDSAYISGEDLQTSFNGLKPEMVVKITKVNDSKTFDQNKQADQVVSALYLQEIGGKDLYKPVILNKTNGKFLVKEFGDTEMDNWLNKPVIVYAQKDSRHGFVVRFKSYKKIHLTADSEHFNKCKLAIQKSGYTIDQIRDKYEVSTEIEKLLTDGKTI